MHNVHFFVGDHVAFVVQEIEKVHSLWPLHQSLAREPSGHGLRMNLDQNLPQLNSCFEPLWERIPFTSFAINLEHIDRSTFVTQFFYNVRKGLEMFWLTQSLIDAVNFSLSSLNSNTKNPSSG